MRLARFLRALIVWMAASPLACSGGAPGLARTTAGGSGVGMGGDQLRVVFERGREVAATRSARLAACSGAVYPAAVREWLTAHVSDLAGDLRDTPAFVLIDSDQGYCARTLPYRAAPISLSTKNCENPPLNDDLAAEVLLHEAVHHFAVIDEGVADNVARFVFSSEWEKSCGNGNGNGGSADGAQRAGELQISWDEIALKPLWRDVVVNGPGLAWEAEVDGARQCAQRVMAALPGALCVRYIGIPAWASCADVPGQYAAMNAAASRAGCGLADAMWGADGHHPFADVLSDRDNRAWFRIEP